jgi:hypothetical protein
MWMETQFMNWSEVAAVTGIQSLIKSKSILDSQAERPNTEHCRITAIISCDLLWMLRHFPAKSRLGATQRLALSQLSHHRRAKTRCACKIIRYSQTQDLMVYAKYSFKGKMKEKVDFHKKLRHVRFPIPNSILFQSSRLL